MESPERSSNEYISFDTTSVVSPIVRANTCVGSISEIFDAEEPYVPRGCVAQAWSIAEVLRCLEKTRTTEVTEETDQHGGTKATKA